jgi:hypothetical protein
MTKTKKTKPKTTPMRPQLPTTTRSNWNVADDDNRET